MIVDPQRPPATLTAYIICDRPANVRQISKLGCGVAMWTHAESKREKRKRLGRKRQSIRPSVQPPVDSSLPIFGPIATLPCGLGILHNRIQGSRLTFLL